MAGDFVPVRVRARLASGIASGDGWGPSLDGIVASIVWQDFKAERLAAGEIPPRGLDPDVDPEDLDLPFARVDADEGWYWAATCGFPEQLLDEPEIRYWATRPDQRDLAQMAARPPASIPDRQGQTRSQLMPIPVLMCSSMVWHALADPLGLKVILDEVLSIGKRRGVGEGEILYWSVEEVDIDPFAASHLFPDGSLGRPTPVSVLSADESVARGPRARWGIRPPALHPLRAAEVYLPVDPRTR